MSNKIKPRTLWELEELGESITALARGAATGYFDGMAGSLDKSPLSEAGFVIAQDALVHKATEEQIAMTIWERLADILEATKQTLVAENN